MLVVFLVCYEGCINFLLVFTTNDNVGVELMVRIRLYSPILH